LRWHNLSNIAIEAALAEAVPGFTKKSPYLFGGHVRLFKQLPKSIRSASQRLSLAGLSAVIVSVYKTHQISFNSYLPFKFLLLEIKNVAKGDFTHLKHYNFTLH
jgi:hypothetical protein